jgi:hypothetical protein
VSSLWPHWFSHSIWRGLRFATPTGGRQSSIPPVAPSVAALRGDPDEWLSQDPGLVYKGDLSLRIEMTDRDYSRTGERFSEPWTEALRAVHPATRQVFWILYGGTLVMEVDTVMIDQHTIVPLPESPDHSTMSRWNYGFGKIVEEYRGEYGGVYSLDSILRQAGITPEDD